MFKLGVNLPAGDYKLQTDSSNKGYYCVYPDSRQSDIVTNKNFESQAYVSVADGQYLVLDRCTLIQ